MCCYTAPAPLSLSFSLLVTYTRRSGCYGPCTNGAAQWQRNQIYIMSA